MITLKRNPLAITGLQPLMITGNSFGLGAAQGTFIGNVQNDNIGSTVTLSALSIANSLQLTFVSGLWKLQVGSSPPATPTVITFDLVETLISAGNSPRTTTGFSVIAGGLHIGIDISVESIPIGA